MRLAWQGISHPTVDRNIGANNPKTRAPTRDTCANCSQAPSRAISEKRDQHNWEHLKQIKPLEGTRLLAKASCVVTMLHRRRLPAAIASSIPNMGAGSRMVRYRPCACCQRIAEPVGGRMTVMVDGRIRRGIYVLKALALGAEFVFVGRTFRYSATIGGMRL
ncbi:alpha-hydroxy-acid oxidizing protein [Rhizobium sp. R693]|uniref:alpha-hydroxy-acid oxidizing protein n=1 Tax=Rhizobium sp. R693 TaxID=1764276 RepID=UPI001FD88137|nr:alpha-hydroxy-acid oxidizing protein [Rhizobium sp. R693]